MCSVSAVSQYYQDQFPQRFPQTGNPFQPNIGAPQVQVADAETREMMRKALDLLDKIDKRLGDIECFDAEKAKFLASLAQSQ